MNNDLTNPLVPKHKIIHDDNNNSYNNTDDDNVTNGCINGYVPNSDEIESCRKITASSSDLSSYSYVSYSKQDKTATATLIDMNSNSKNSSSTSNKSDTNDIDYHEILPKDIFNKEWQIKMEELLDFDMEIDDKTLEQRLKNQSYSLRSMQLQQIVEFLPSMIANEIISYELSKDSVEIFIRRSLMNNVRKNKFSIFAFISGWILTFIGLYLFLCGLSLFNIISITDFIQLDGEYFMGNYSEIGWRVELCIVLTLCTLHFICIIDKYNAGKNISNFRTVYIHTFLSPFVTFSF